MSEALEILKSCDAFLEGHFLLSSGRHSSALKLDLPNYAPEECPICKEGKLPLVHLGSRKMKQEAKQTL